jgi:carbonic anhydrase
MILRRPTSIRVTNHHCQALLASTALLLAAATHSLAQQAPAKESNAPTENARPVHWAYSGDEGPAKWGELSPVYSACCNGKIQSPVDIVGSGPGNGAVLKFDYRKTSLKIAHHEHVIDIIDNGHTIQVTVEEGSTLTTARDIYQLKQFHFHTPSEHTVDGKHFPMEVHFVHQSAKREFAVVAAFYKEGADNENLAKLIANMPKAKGDTQHFPDVSLDLQFHLPTKARVYSYIGSFTTPPCTENVEWFILQEPVTAGAAQIKAFADRLQNNNRPVQPLNERKVGAADLNKDVTP